MITALIQDQKARQTHQTQKVLSLNSLNFKLIKIIWLKFCVERGRTRRKRRDFFGTIKKRLSRSKTRSRSAGPNDDSNHEDAHSRSISADRAGSGNFDFNK